jgi:hypothetical protein
LTPADNDQGRFGRNAMNPHDPACVVPTMANYVANYTKKREALQRREDNLRRLLTRGEGKAKLLQAAEEVRLARIRVLRSHRATFRPVDPDSKQFANIDSRIQAVEEVTAMTILAEFLAEQTDAPPRLS